MNTEMFFPSLASYFSEKEFKLKNGVYLKTIRLSSNSLSFFLPSVLLPSKRENTFRKKKVAAVKLK